MIHEEYTVTLRRAGEAVGVGNYDEAAGLANEVLSELDQQGTTDNVARAAALRVLGNVARLHAKYEMALDHLTTALHLSETINDTSGMAEALRIMGSVYANRSEHDQALSYYAQALALAEQAEDEAEKARNLGNIAIVYDEMAEYVQALEYYARALAIDDELGNKAGVSKWLGGTGSVESNLANYDRALEYYHQALVIDTQLGNKSGIAAWLCNIGNTYLNLSDYPRALEYYNQALAVAEEIGMNAFVQNTLGNIGLLYGKLGNHAQSLEYSHRALAIAKDRGTKGGESKFLGNIGAVYYALADYARALEFFEQSLTIAEELGNSVDVAIWLGNIGVSYAGLQDDTRALEYFNRALAITEKIGSKVRSAGWMSNIGNVYARQGDYSKALDFHNKSLAIHEELGDKAGVADTLANIGQVHMRLSRYQTAFDYCVRSLQVYEDIGLKSEVGVAKGNIGMLYATREFKDYDEQLAEKYLLESTKVISELGTKKFEIFKSLAELYERQERWKEFAVYFKEYYQLEREVLNEQATKTAAQMEQRRQIADREKEIAIAKTAHDATLKATTSLLYKVLPQTIATRMIAGEEEIADYFPQVSILFADIVGFTPISAEMPAFIVVRFLNYVFREFDKIIEHHGCEKIKTIGDGYMAVAGAPIPCEDHAERLAAVAFEMQQLIELPDEIREFIPDGTTIGVRIGLHTGPIVAGVIGENRFVYDVYSDAVNTASRMESHGQPNRIHVTSEYVRHLQNRYSSAKNTSHGMLFIKREPMEIKGKGLMRTYFMEQKGA